MSRRLEGIKPGDQLAGGHGWGNCFWLVTDVWFDPVRGQRRRASGEMVAIQMLDAAGRPFGTKWAHTIRGLAQAGYRPARFDYAAMAAARSEAIKEGKVVGIGAGARIKQRNQARTWSRPL